MLFLVVNGLEVDVQVNGAAQDAPEQLGKSTLSFEGSVRSTLRESGRRGSYTWTTRPYGDHEWATLQAMMPNAKHVMCYGAGIELYDPAAPALFEVTHGPTGFVQRSNYFLRTLTFYMKQVQKGIIRTAPPGDPVTQGTFLPGVLALSPPYVTNASAKAVPMNAAGQNLADRVVTFTVAPSGIATVEPSAVTTSLGAAARITPVAAGQATVTAMCEGINLGSVTVNVS